MNPSMRSAAGVVLAILVLGACGGDKKDSAAAPKGTTSSTASSTTSSTAQGGAVGAGLLSQRCRSYTGYAAAVGLAFAAATNPDAAAQLRDLKDKADIADAPEEIRDDFAVLIDYAKKLGDVLARYPSQSGTVNPAAIGAITELARNVDQKRLDEASKKINTWVTANCTGY